MKKREIANAGEKISEENVWSNANVVFPVSGTESPMAIIESIDNILMVVNTNWNLAPAIFFKMFRPVRKSITPAPAVVGEIENPKFSKIQGLKLSK